MDASNGEARTGVAVLTQRMDDCQRHHVQRFDLLEAQVNNMDKRVAAAERALLGLKIYGGIALFVLTAVVSPVMVVVLLRHFGAN